VFDSCRCWFRIWQLFLICSRANFDSLFPHRSSFRNGELSPTFWWSADPHSLSKCGIEEIKKKAELQFEDICYQCFPLVGCFNEIIFSGSGGVGPFVPGARVGIPPAGGARGRRRSPTGAGRMGPCGGLLAATDTMTDWPSAQLNGIRSN